LWLRDYISPPEKGPPAESGKFSELFSPYVGEPLQGVAKTDRAKDGNRLGTG